MARPEPIARTITDVPVLIASPAEFRTAPPIVFWFHGFRADAAANAAELADLAAAGFLAVGVDAVGHGARRDPDLDARIAAAPGGALAVMFDQAAATIAELPALVAALASSGMGDATRVGLVGVSMGAFLAYRAALVVPGVRAVAAVLGSPEWPDPESPHLRPAAFRDVALLSITAAEDVNVPPAPARRLHVAVAARDDASQEGSAPDRSRYVELPGAQHMLTAAEWGAAMRAARHWMRTHL